MNSGTGQIDETFINSGRAARITCAPNLVPAPGQYLLAHAPTEPARPLPIPVFRAASHPRGFYAASPLPVSWTPGTQLALRGPLGRGFQLPASARRVALAALGGNASRLLALLEFAIPQKAEITLLAHTIPENLPPAIEILPLSALADAAKWADYLAMDAPRATLTEIHNLFPPASRPMVFGYTTEILVEMPMPCGGMATCGACALQTQSRYFLACKDGPVFDLKSIV